MVEVTAVVLAAGLSRRMGQDNKLLLPIDSAPMIARTLRAYLDFCDEVVVVTGFDADCVTAALGHLQLRLVHNPDFATGQASSVAAGLKAVQGARHVVVGLGDQPTLMPQHLATIFGHHIREGGEKITVPYNGATRGNPIVIPGNMLGQMLEDKQNPGCGKFTRERPDLVNLTRVTEDAYFHDVDTPSDYAALTQRSTATVEAQ